MNMKVFSDRTPSGLPHINADIKTLWRMGRPQCNDTIIDNRPEVNKFL
jgi:hypothetical protein